MTAFAAEAGGGEVGGDFLFELGGGQAVVGAGVDRGAVAGEAALAGEDFVAIVGGTASPGSTTATIGEIELLGELEVARVVRGHGHDRAGAVADQHVVGDPDRNRLAVDRIDGVASR